MDRPPQPTRLGTDVVAVSRALFKKVLAEFGSACPRHHDEWEEDGCIDELAAALDAALAAQEGERGGAEVAALGRDAMADVLRPMDRIWNPYTIVDALIAAGYRLIRTTHCNAIGCVDHADGMHVDARGDAIVHIGCDLCRTVPADPAGALATHDAEVLRAAVDEMPSMFTEAARHWLRERADRLEGERS